MIEDSHSPPFLLACVVVAVISTIATSNFTNYHLISTDTKEMMAQYSLSAADIGALFQAYSLPNIVMVFVGGCLLDFFGVITASVAFSGLILIGSIIFALAPIGSSWTMPVLLLGRFVIGLGGESVFAAASVMCARWFKDSTLNLAMGVLQAWVQIFGSAFIFWIGPIVADLPSVPFRVTPTQLASWIGVAVAAISVVAAFMYGYLEHHYSRFLISEVRDSEAESIPLLKHDSKFVVDLDDEDRPTTSWQRFRSMISALRAQTMESMSSYSPLLYLLLIHSGLLSPLLYTFTAFGPLFLQEKYGYDSTDAGRVTSYLYAAILMSPVFGYLVDRFGHRSLVQIIVSALIVPCFGALHFTTWSPAVIFILLGLCFSITEANAGAMSARTTTVFSPHHSFFGSQGMSVCFAINSRHCPRSAWHGSLYRPHL